MKRFHARKRAVLSWNVSTNVPAHVECVSLVVSTRRARQTAVEPSSVVTSVLNRVPTSVHLAVDLVRIDVTTVTVRKTAVVLVIHVVNVVCGPASTSSVLDCVTSHVIDLDVINLVPDSYHVDIHVSGFAERRVLPSVECVTTTR